MAQIYLLFNTVLKRSCDLKQMTDIENVRFK